MTRVVIALMLMLASSAGVVVATDAPLPVQEALTRIEADGLESRSDALLVMCGDEVLLERYTDADPVPIELMSVTKSVVALVIGRLLTQGHIESLDTPVSHWYPEWKQGNKRGITLRMLMDHTSGLQNVPHTSVEIYPAPDMVQLALAAELDTKPGTRFSYNNKAVNLLAGIVQRASGQPLDAYAHEHLFAPLQILAGAWQKDSEGHPHAMSGLPLTARDAARLAQLVLQRGRWQRETLIAPDFIDAMLAPSALLDEVGLLWWRVPAWTRFAVDQRTFDLLESRGIDAGLIADLRPLDGQAFASFDALNQALTTRLGAQWRERWTREVVEPSGLGPYPAFNSEVGPIAVYEARGYLGQSIVVIPSASLIGVRQIRERDDYRPGDAFSSFTESLLALAAAMDALPEAH